VAEIGPLDRSDGPEIVKVTLTFYNKVREYDVSEESTNKYCQEQWFDWSHDCSMTGLSML
jgi:hypothetical protein